MKKTHWLSSLVVFGMLFGFTAQAWSGPEERGPRAKSQDGYRTRGQDREPHHRARNPAPAVVQPSGEPRGWQRTPGRHIIQITRAIGAGAPAIARIRNSPRAIGFLSTGNRILKPRRADPTTPIAITGPIRHTAAPRTPLGRTEARTARGGATFSVQAGRPGRS